MERLDKLIALQANMTRSEAQRLIRAGKVTVDGAACRNPAAKLDPQSQRAALGGRPIAYKEHLYLMLNKPARPSLRIPGSPRPHGGGSGAGASPAAGPFPGGPSGQGYPRPGAADRRRGVRPSDPLPEKRGV